MILVVAALFVILMGVGPGLPAVATFSLDRLGRLDGFSLSNPKETSY